jgi:hypothetical protein
MSSSAARRRILPATPFPDAREPVAARAEKQARPRPATMVAAPPPAPRSMTDTEARSARMTLRLRPESADALRRELIAIREETGGRTSIDDVLAAGVAMLFVAQGKVPPTPELQAAIRPYVQPLQEAPARKALARCSKRRVARAEPI